jgi:hypothetical protein
MIQTPLGLHYHTILRLYTKSIHSYRQRVTKQLTIHNPSIDVDYVLTILSIIPRKRFDTMYYNMHNRSTNCLVEKEYNQHYRNVSILMSSLAFSDHIIHTILNHCFSQLDDTDSLYDRLDGFAFLDYPIRVSPSICNNRFLSMAMEFTIAEEHMVVILSTRPWIIFGNVYEYLDLSRSSLSILYRCWDIKSSHMLFEYQSRTHGRIHIVPNALICIGSEYVEEVNHQPAHLPFEYTFDHTCHFLHPSHNQPTKNLTCSYVDPIVRHATTNPIGRTMGSFYQTSGFNVILVTPSMVGIGHVLYPSDLILLDQITCSMICLSPAVDICSIVVESIRRIPNGKEIRPSYIIVPDHEIPFWTNALSRTIHNHIYLLSFSDALTTSLPKTHVLVIDEAHMIGDFLLFPNQYRHIICVSTKALEHQHILMKLCGIDQLPFPPLEPIRDAFVIHDITLAPVPSIYLIPSSPTSKTSFKREGFHELSVGVLQNMLRNCAGLPSLLSIGKYQLTNTIPSLPSYTEETDPCMICLSDIIENPVMLSCRHVLCCTCLSSILQQKQKQKQDQIISCPVCRFPIHSNMQRPQWVTSSTISPTKQVHVKKYVLNYLSRRKKTDVLCIITAYPEIVCHYQKMLVVLQNESNDHDHDSDSGTLPGIVIISPSDYDRHIHHHTTEVLITDIDSSQSLLSNLLYSDRNITLMLTQGGVDEFLFHSWTRKRC